MVAAVVAAMALPQPAAAREVRLGGQQTTKPGNLPPNIVELPSIVVAIPKDDGGWHHIKIDAWLAPDDVGVAHKLDNIKSVIVKKSQDALPQRPFDSLKSAHEGSALAKKTIHEAAEASLGKEWKGEVMIRSMLVY